MQLFSPTCLLCKSASLLHTCPPCCCADTGPADCSKGNTSGSFAAQQPFSVNACFCCIPDSPVCVCVQELMTPLEETPATAQGGADQAMASLSSCLQDLPQSVLLGLTRAGVAHRMPLTVALVSARARQQAAALDFMAWRDLVAGICTESHCVGQITAHSKVMDMHNDESVHGFRCAGYVLGMVPSVCARLVPLGHPPLMLYMYLVKTICIA